MGRFEELDLTSGMIFYDHAIPTLSAGTYRIQVDQKIVTKEIVLAEKKEDDKVFSYEQKFHVTGPRFGLGPADVHSVHPPPNSLGQFEETIPHVVFRRRTLAWEREIEGAPKSRPWLALLVFHENELPATAARTLTIDQAIASTAGSGVLPPAISLSELDAADLAEAARKESAVQARTIEVDPDQFRSMMPRPDEVELLAHVRQVSTGDKELLGMLEDGWFSVVLANRVPGVGVNTAHLVSLEGWQGLLAGQPPPAGTTKLRLISLVSWTFTSLPARGSFAALMGHIDVGKLQIPVPPAIRNQPGDSEEARTARTLEGALERGYVPLTYDMRHGQHTAAWYRGPLLPVVTQRQSHDPFASAEAGLIYDSTTGMFDVSFAVAWQIGRLLALSDARFSAALAEWRQEGHRVLDSMIEKAEIAARFAEEGLWVKIGDIHEAPPERKRDLAIQLLRDLLDPKVFGGRLSTMIVQQFDALRVRSGAASAEVLVKGAPESKKRLAGSAAPSVKFDDLADSGLDAAATIRDRVLAEARRQAELGG